MDSHTNKIGNWGWSCTHALLARSDTCGWLKLNWPGPNPIENCYADFVILFQFQPHGYLFLATEEGVEVMQENHRVQM